MAGSPKPGYNDAIMDPTYLPHVVSDPTLNKYYNPTTTGYGLSIDPNQVQARAAQLIQFTDNNSQNLSGGITTGGGTTGQPVVNTLVTPVSSGGGIIGTTAGQIVTSSPATSYGINNTYLIIGAIVLAFILFRKDL